MNYIMHYNIAAIGIMLLTIYILVARKDLKRSDNRILLILCIMHIISAIAETIAILMERDIPRLGLFPAKLFNYVFLFVHTQMMLVLIVYIVSLLGVREKLSAWFKSVLILPSAAVLIVLALNPFLDWYFYFNEQNVFTNGPMTAVIFGGPLVQMLILSWLIARYRQELPDNMFSPVILFLILSAGSLAIQFFYKEWLIELFAQSLGLLGMMITLENKDDVRALVSMMEELEKEKQSAEEAREQADSANRSKSDFLSNMSHEIRTPINAVLGMNEMILRESGDERITTYARNVESAGKNLLSIINDILDFSKIEAGKMEIVAAPYKLSSVLNDLSNMITFRARSKDLAFRVDVDETIPDNLNGDEVRVRQIVTNVLTNAVKYTMEGSVTLTVCAERKEEGKITLVLKVKDTGIGIKEEDIGKLFTKFSRVDLKQTNTIEGTGLGLAITENLLLLMQGDIRVSSVYGEGTTFTIRIPQGIVSEEAIGDFQQRFEEGLKKAESYHESFHAPEAYVLVVDDTELNLVVIEGLLKTTEVKLDTASGGEEALQLTKDTPYDLILLDQRMPHMSGTEVLQHIRAQEGGCNKETPVICLTADAVQGARERYLEEGFSDYLSKPVEGHALEATLMKYLPPERIIRMTGEKRTADEKDRQRTGTVAAQNAAEAGSAEGKNTLRMIGGAQLSLLAEKPEADGNEIRAGEGKRADEALRAIKEKTPELLASLRELETSLRPFLQKADEPDEDLPELSREELNELYEAIPEFVEVYDQDGILRLLQQIDGYRIPEADREKLEQLRKCAGNSDWNGLKEVLKG
ncbi:MAG: response regulator [Lachnospiraceae bacterium]|nr:response regulator [Lachnospiraceae bacterium]